MTEFYFNGVKHDRVRLADMQDHQGRRDGDSDPQAKINSANVDANTRAIEQLMQDLSSDAECVGRRGNLDVINGRRLATALQLLAIGDTKAARIWIKQLDPSVVEQAVRSVGNLLSELLAYDSVSRLKGYRESP